MKSFNLFKVVGSGVLIASLATLPLALPASAQDGTVRDSNQAAPGDKAIYGTGEIDRGERSFDWGWIGLLGLVGLAGRLAKHRQEAVDYSEHNQINRPVTTVINEEAVSYREHNQINLPVTTEVTNEEAVRYKEPKEMNGLGTTEEAVRYRDPQETNRFGTTEKPARYKDPQEMNRPGTDGTSKKY